MDRLKGGAASCAATGVTLGFGGPSSGSWTGSGSAGRRPAGGSGAQTGALDEDVDELTDRSGVATVDGEAAIPGL